MKIEHLKTVIFDLDGTLRVSQPSGSDVFMDFVAAQGLALTTEDRKRAERWEHYYWASSPELALDLKAYPDDEDAFWANNARRHIIALGGSAEQSARIAPPAQQYMKNEHRPAIVTPPGLIDALISLQAAGLKLAVLSNRDNAFDHRVREVGLDPYFALCLAAGQLGAYKPDPAVFHRTCERIGCLPAQAVYVGDNYFADVVGSRAAGLSPVLYDPRAVFPDPGCPVITDFNQLLPLLEQMDGGAG
jgi:HAD superfamily hydrolase (TIGR01549 family)